MNFKQFIEAQDSNITQNPDGSITIGDLDILSPQFWERVNNFMRRKGFDYRGPEDAKALFARNSRRTYSNEQAEAIKNAVGIGRKPRPPRTPAAKLLTKIKRYYGLTNNYELAGFILADGGMLDFSEGSGTRAQDHRNIASFLDETMDRTVAMNKFCKDYRAMRVHVTPTYSFVCIHAAPTTQQLNHIRNIKNMTAELQLVFPGSRKTYGKNDHSYIADIQRELG